MTAKSMQFVGRRGRPITSIDEWAAVGKPAAASHWKPGRSAYELACDWLELGAAQRVTDLVATLDVLEDAELKEAVAEKRTQFDDIARGPRNHDLLVRGICAHGNVTIAVEGKADEPFDNPLWLWRDKALRDRPASDAPRRLDELTKRWFGTTIDRDWESPPIACLGYQLLSALAGTIADAKIDESPWAVLLIHEFVTDETDDATHEANARMLDGFLDRLAKPTARHGHADAWITDPIAVRGDGKWARTETAVAVAKLVARLR